MVIDIKSGQVVAELEHFPSPERLNEVLAVLAESWPHTAQVKRYSVSEANGVVRLYVDWETGHGR